jgi:CPA2 family monovalent cation:H+ antiporter-2
VLLGPFTPGYVADQKLANDLAEIGVILLMFGVGLHFTLEDLLSVRAIALPAPLPDRRRHPARHGACLAARLVDRRRPRVRPRPVGRQHRRAAARLQERRLVETERGRIAVGWLVVEDFVMILALVLLPSLAASSGAIPTAGMASLALPILWTLIKVAAFVAVMLVIGKRVIPWVLHTMAHTGSRELFRLAVLAIALGVAYGASVIFDVSFALGAFFAGMILSESELSQRAASETLPLRDAFAVLFFVSVGMLVDPMIVVTDPGWLLATLLIIWSASRSPPSPSCDCSAIRPRTRSPSRRASPRSASSPSSSPVSASACAAAAHGRDLILAGAIISILLNPVLFACLDWYLAKGKPAASAPDLQAAAEQALARADQAHAAHRPRRLVGYGRVGRLVSDGLKAQGLPVLLIEENRPLVAQARAAGIEVIHGNAANHEVIEAANLASARHLIVAIPDAFEGGQIVMQARQINPLCRSSPARTPRRRPPTSSRTAPAPSSWASMRSPWPCWPILSRVA